MDTTRHGVTRMVVNTHQQMTGDFTRNVDFQFPGPSLKRTIANGVGDAQAEFVDATRIATALLGDSIATNMFMLGYAYQRGLVPVSAEAINKAIELNGAAVKMNQAAFLWGRRAAVDHGGGRAPDRTEDAAEDRRTQLSQSLEEVIERRVEFLTGYQNAAYAERYRALVERVRQAEAAKAKGRQWLGRSGGSLLLQADGLQGRVRSGAAVHADRVRSSVSARSSRATTSCTSIWRRRCSPSAIR